MSRPTIRSFVLLALSAGMFIDPLLVSAQINEPYFDQQWSLQNTGNPTVVGSDSGILRYTNNGSHMNYFGEYAMSHNRGIDLGITNLRNSFSGKGIVVAVIDTGIDISHPDLANQIWVNRDEVPDNGIDDDHNGFIDDSNGWNFFANNNDLSDQVGHGTAIAGIIAAEKNGVGVEGVAPEAKIMPLKVSETNKGISFSDVANAIVYAVNQGADVINISITGMFGPDDLLVAANYAQREGVIIVAAAGNDGGNMIMPGSIDSVVGVGAIRSDGQIAKFSAHNPDLVAPGVGILAPRAQGSSCKTFIPVEGPLCDIDDNLVVAGTGTSFAAANVSGVAALLKSARPDIDANLFKLLTTGTATDQGDSGRDDEFGMGMINADAAYNHYANNPLRQISRDKKVLREKFLVELLRARNVDTGSTSIAANLVFDGFDSPERKSIATAKKLGVIKGRWFKPDKPITKYEALALIERLVDLPETTSYTFIANDIVLENQREIVARSFAAGIGKPWNNYELNQPLTGLELDNLIVDIKAL
jgi:subtilisin family serine protease